MRHYPVSLVPGPTAVPESVRRAYLEDFGSADLERDYLELYARNQADLQRLLHTQNAVAVMSGEGMVVLWGAVKSILAPGDRLLAVSSGLFGSAFADMARACGAEARLVERHDGLCPSIDEVRATALTFRPTVITAVHCETPSGMLNPLDGLGELAHEIGALFLADCVASAGGAPVAVDRWGIDLALMGSQKCLSMLPDQAMVAVSNRAWEVIERRRYEGYDALLPWRRALENEYFPYTPNWHGAWALHAALTIFFNEGEVAVLARHAETAAFCRRRLEELGLKTYPKEERLNSPTVTALEIPQGWTWSELNSALRDRGVVVGGTFGPLSGSVFRVGHMGSQAHPELIEALIAALSEILDR